MEERAGSKRAFVVAWLLTLGFVVAVGPFGSPAETEECGAASACAPSKEMRQHRLEMRERKQRPRATAEVPEDRLRIQEWQGNHPEICFVKGCDDGPPTFCHVARKLPIAEEGLRVPKDRDPCAREPNFRTARG